VIASFLLLLSSKPQTQVDRFTPPNQATLVFKQSHHNQKMKSLLYAWSPPYIIESLSPERQLHLGGVRRIHGVAHTSANIYRNGSAPTPRN
jgi:hypothetical protein